MIKNRHLGSIVTLFLMLGCNANGQERKILEGRVLGDSLAKVEPIHVINLTAESGTTTDENGDFRLQSKEGDTIYFSTLQFQNKKLVVKAVHLTEGMRVRLHPAMNELDEVQLDDIKLSGSLAHDIEKVPKSIYTRLGWSFPKKPQTSLEMGIQSSGSKGGDPVGLFLNTLNGKIKELEKASLNYELLKSVEKALGLLGADYISSSFNIPEKEIHNFLYFNADKREFLRLVSEKDLLGMIQLMEKNLPDFQKLRKLK